MAFRLGGKRMLTAQRRHWGTLNLGNPTFWQTTSMSFDPRVTYGDEPWNNPLKESTGLAGVPVEHRWRKKLMALYSHILNDIKMVPEDNAYRQCVENVYREFLRIVSNVGDTDWRIVERKIGLGQVEQLIYFAMDERELVQSYCEWKLWLIPVETVRQLHEESKVDMYFNYVGPPEPYLSDEEINDMKKIDQQRMAEEQKHIAADLKKLAGRTSRMLIDDQESRAQKRMEYKQAIDEYIRETKMDTAVRIYNDGAVEAPSVSGVQIPNVSAGDNLTTGQAAVDVDPAKKDAILNDWRETVYWARDNANTGSDGTGIPFDASGGLPTRMEQWKVDRETGQRTTSATDSPHEAPVARGSKQGRRIAKWIKPEHALGVTSEAPPQKE